MTGLRAKKSNKRRKTFDKFGKYTKKSLRINMEQAANAEENSKNKSANQQQIAQQNKNKNKKNKKKNKNKK